MTKKLKADFWGLPEASWEDFQEAVRVKTVDILRHYPEAVDFGIAKERMDVYSDNTEIVLSFKRLENDKEYKARIDQESRQIKWREVHDKAEFERLKKKFAKSP